MPYNRHILNHLVAWGKEPVRKPLVLRGARQVGKSTIVRMLAQKLQLDLVEVNLERDRDYASLFKTGDPKTTLQLLSLKLNKPIHPSKSLLFLDEIQTAPEILALLRYFYEDIPGLHIVCAGSLLEFALQEVSFSMPVGRIEYIYLGPMTFSEFLVALDQQGLAEYLKNFHYQQTIPEAIHNQFMHFTKLYHIVGGMPEAISKFAVTQDFIQVERTKHSILETYQDDFTKYSTPHQENRLREVFNKISLLIGKKLKYSEINNHVKSTVIANTLEKLTLARIIYLIRHTAANGIPLGAEINSKIMKPLFLDIGLLVTQCGIGLLNITNIEDLTLINNGAMAEQFIGQHLLYLPPYYKKPELYYWHREKKSSQAEVDYVLSVGQHIIPIEVKAGKTGRLRSLQLFGHEKNPALSVRFNCDAPSFLNASTDERSFDLLSLPLYLVEELQRLVQLKLEQN